MGRLLHIGVKNYGPIKEAKTHIEPDYTILAGKNETGKTSILRALRDMNYDNSISNEAIPIGGKDDERNPQITIFMEYSKAELDFIKENYPFFADLLEFLGVLNEEKSIIIKITKKYP